MAFTAVAQVQSLVKELGSHKLYSTAKNKQKQKLIIKILNQMVGNTPINHQRYSFKLSHLYNENNNSVHLTGLFYRLNE